MAEETGIPPGAGIRYRHELISYLQILTSGELFTKKCGNIG
jgi:hypothetical protein